ncbi:hypothetical protein SpCBS45565_g03234 [Spizellomyces sp. 'palustris']|nr:hypothetical protein SpCBS45565_g03234 [Spizellomyces sp. 'palustris']
MFLLRNLGNLVFGAGNNDSLVELSLGQLYKIDPRAGSAKQLTFRDAAATIRRTSSPYSYQLVITRLYEEGEDNADEDDLLNNERTFLLDAKLRFRRVGDRKGPSLLHWADLDDDSGQCGWEFAVDSTIKEPTLALFEDTAYTCMFERMARKSHADVSDDELTAFVDQVKARAAANPIGQRGKDIQSPRTPLSAGSTNQGNPELRTPQQSSITSSPAPATPTPAPFGRNASLTSQQGTPLRPALPSAAVPEGVVLDSTKAQLFVFDIRVYHFVMMQSVVTAELIETEAYQFHLVVKDSDRVWVSQPIEDRMSPTFNVEQRSFVWVQYDAVTGKPLYTWSLKFTGEPGSEAEFKQLISECMYETMNKEEFRKMKKDEQEYLMKIYEEDPMDVDEPEEEPAEEEEEEWEEEVDAARQDATDGRDSDDENAHLNELGAGSKNSQLAVGYKNDRSFVVRGDKIGVFRHADDDQLKFSTTINNIRTLSGNTFSPRKIMLHEQDSSMVMMKPGDDHNLYKMDLEYGKVVEEWKVDENRTVQEIVPDTKYAQLTPAKTLVGIGHNSLFRIDPRLAGTKIVENESKQYATKYGFTCAATTGKGELAIGSEKGEIRLYNKLNVRAKTNLPGLGDPIIGIDTTENGRYIIATCRSHLLLIDTEIKGTGGQSGFQKSMGGTKPQPKRLQLKPEHVAWLGSEITFTPAKFSTGDSEESAIITSTGPHVIRWNFRRVKAGKLYDYTIKTYADKVVADNFKFGQDRAMIITLPENVEMITKNKLSTPVKMLKSRNSIVNSPY